MVVLTSTVPHVSSRNSPAMIAVLVDRRSVNQYEEDSWIGIAQGMGVNTQCDEKMLSP